MDICRLLHNKLDSADQWSGENIVSSLTPEFCASIKTCYHSLEPQVKIKLLLAILHMPQKMMENASTELQEIFALADSDTDEWPRVISKMLKDFPREGVVKTDLSDENWCDAVKNISSMLAESASANLRPLERLYMSGASNKSITTQQHFKFSARHKSTAARAELIAKGREMQEQKRREEEAKRDDGGIPQYRGQTTAVPTPAARKPVSSLQAAFKAREKRG
eukprot:sb/3469756/